MTYYEELIFSRRWQKSPVKNFSVGELKSSCSQKAQQARYSRI